MHTMRPGAVGDPVVWMCYEHPSRPFDPILGLGINLLTSRPVPFAGPLLNRLLEALRTQDLSRKIYGLRVITAHRDGRLHTNEVLLDRQTWLAVEAVVADSGAPLQGSCRVIIRLNKTGRAATVGRMY